MIRATQFSPMGGPMGNPWIWTYPQHWISWTEKFTNETFVTPPLIKCFHHWQCARVLTWFDLMTTSGSKVNCRYPGVYLQPPPKGRYRGHGQVITSYSVLYDIISYLWPGYLYRKPYTGHFIYRAWQSAYVYTPFALCCVLFWSVCYDCSSARESAP